MTRFYLIRHATTDSVGKRLSGRKEGVGLNEQGKNEAQQLVQRLRFAGINTIFSSPLQRARETAEPLASSLAIDINTSEDFNEIDFGKWTDASFKQLGDDPQFSLFNTFRSQTRIPGGETMAEAQLRIVRGMQTLKQTEPDRNVAIVSHADMIKAALLYFMGMPIDLFTRIEISPASVSILEVYNDSARVMLLNHVGDIKM